MKKVLLIILFFVSFILTGCVKMDVTKEIDKNGLANVKIIYDTTKMNLIQEEMKKDKGDGLKLNSSSKEPCSGSGSNELNLTNYKCTIIDKDRYAIEGQFDFSKSKSFYAEKGIYIYNLSKGFKELNSKNDNPSKIRTKEEIEQEKKMLLTMGIEASILVKMPGTTIKNDIGKLDNNIVSVSYADLISLDDFYIVSKNNDLDITGIQITEILNKVKVNDSRVSIFNGENKSKYSKQKILSISKLKNTKQAKYIAQIDMLVEKTDSQKLTTIFDKIQKLKKKNIVIEYLESVIYLKLSNNNPDTQDETSNNKVVPIIKKPENNNDKSVIIGCDKMGLKWDGNNFYNSVFKLKYTFDLSTISCISDKYTKDKNGFYYVSLSTVKKLENIDEKSFGINSNGVLYDKNSIYFLNLKLNYNFDIESVKIGNYGVSGGAGGVEIKDKNGNYDVDIKSIDKGDYIITKK